MDIWKTLHLFATANFIKVVMKRVQEWHEQTRMEFFLWKYISKIANVSAWMFWMLIRCGLDIQIICPFELYAYDYAWTLNCTIQQNQEGYIEELTRFSQCLNAKTGFVNSWSVYQSFLYWIFMFQIIHFQKILEGQCLN